MLEYKKAMSFLIYAISFILLVNFTTGKEEVLFALLGALGLKMGG